MMSNTKLKLLLVLLIMLSAICLFNTKVNAVTDTEIEAILNEIPSSMTVDVKEIEYDKANDIILTSVADKLREAGITDIKVSSDGSLDGSYSGITILGGIYDYLDFDSFYKADIVLYRNNQQIAQKEISITYSNSASRNTTDEQYIKNIKLESPKYYEVALSNIHKDGFDVLSMARNYYQNKVNDNSITILTTAGAYGGEPLSSWTHGTVILMFKNDILYDLRHIGDEFTVPVITVPSNVSNIEEYAINQLNIFLKDTYNDGTKVTNLEKGTDIDINISDIYSTDIGNYVIIRQEQPEIVNDTDTTTNIKLDATTDVVPSGTKLIVEEITTGTSYNTVVTALGDSVSKFEMYDISLMSGNTVIQPSGRVKISIPVPSGYDTSKIVVYRVDDNGTKTEYDTAIENGFIVFETDHFSNYVVAEQTTSSETSDNKPTEDTNTTNTTGQLDNTPKTGEETNVASVISVLVSTLSALGLAIVKKF